MTLVTVNLYVTVYIQKGFIRVVRQSKPEKNLHISLLEFLTYMYKIRIQEK